MTTARHIFIREFFESLEAQQYVALKYILDQPEQLPTTSDFDLLVTPRSQDFIIQFCEQHGLLQKMRMEHVLERRSLFLYFADGSFLKLDLLMDFFLKGWRYLDKDLLLRRSVLRNGVRQCHPLHLFEHVVLYYQLNDSGVPERYVKYFKKRAVVEQSLMLSYFSEKYRSDVTLFDDMAYALPELKDSIFRKLSFKSDNQGRRLWGRKAQTALTALRNRIPKAGKIITFSGVDGAGKSTMLHAMAKEIRAVHHRKVVVLRHRPGLLPILSSWRYGKQEAEARATVSLPRQGTNTHFLGSLLRFAYYFTDYLFGQFWVYFRYCLLGYIVIYDRYYFDFIVDPRRSNISIPSQWVKQLWRLLIKPQLNVLLYAPPSEIHRRKQELSQPVIQSLTKDYQQLFQELQQDAPGTYQVIQNQDQMRTLHQLMQRYYQTCV